MVFWLIFNALWLGVLYAMALDKWFKYIDTLEQGNTSFLIQLTGLAVIGTLSLYGIWFLFWAGWENPFSFIAKLPEFIQGI